MQFFYIDYIKDGRKERNIGFLRVENDGISIGLRGVPVQCGNSCKVYVINHLDRTILLGEVELKDGYGLKKFVWKKGVQFEECMRVEVPLYGSRKGVCILRDKKPNLQSDKEKYYEFENTSTNAIVQKAEQKEQQETPNANQQTALRMPYTQKKALDPEVYDEIHEDKWQQLLTIYPQVHICPDAQSILIRPKDAVILTRQYHELASNSFVLHAYYNYRQLLLFKYMKDIGTSKERIRAAQETTAQYYLGVPGVYYEREQRIAQMFGFEGFENGEARMQQDADRKVYKGCFGYYMKRVDI